MKLYWTIREWIAQYIRRDGTYFSLRQIWAFYSEARGRTEPFPVWVYQKWAYGCGLQVGAQYMLEDGHYTRLQARIDRTIGRVIEFLFDWWWWR